MICPFNWTKVELKLFMWKIIGLKRYAFNWTKVELKLIKKEVDRRNSYPF